MESTRMPRRQRHDEDYARPPLPKEAERTEKDTVIKHLLGAKVSKYTGVSAHDQARQHNGDAFYGNVTFQYINSPLEVSAPAQDGARSEFLKSLEFDQMDLRYMAAHTHLVGTCEWLLETPEYQMWLDPELMAKHGGFLWIKGRVGAGKSTIMKFATACAEANCSDKEHVLYFFFNARGGPLETSEDGLFRSLLYQLLDKVPGIYSMLDKRRLDIVKRHGWSSALLKDTFRDAVLRLTHDTVTCFIDAMDECDADEVEGIIGFFDDLADVVSADARRVRVCLSSRPYPNLRSIRSVGLELEKQQGHNQDIRMYVEKRLVIDGEDLKEDLIRRIEIRARGVFMWVVLVVSMLNKDDRCGNTREIYDRLDQVPGKLSELFDGLLTRGSYNPYFRPLLRLITFSYSDLPLSPRAIYSALILGTSPSRNNKVGTYPGFLEGQTHEKLILDASKGLVEIAGYRASVQYIHESVRTFFLGEGQKYLISDEDMIDDLSAANGNRSLDVADKEMLTALCHDELKRFCLRYVVNVVKDTTFDYKQCDLSKTGPFPFFEYAIGRLWTHADAAQSHGIPQDTFVETLPPDALDATNHKLGITPADQIDRAWYTKACQMTCNECPELLKSMLEAKPLPASESWKLSYLLSVSISKGSVDCTSVLLHAGADPDGDSLFDITHLEEAMSHWNKRLMIQLLEAGARPYGRTRERTTDVLYRTCSTHGEYKVRLLLGQPLIADDFEAYSRSLASAFGKTISSYSGELNMFLFEKGREVGLWSQWVPQTANKQAMELTTKDSAIAFLIQAETPEVCISRYDDTKVTFSWADRYVPPTLPTRSDGPRASEFSTHATLHMRNNRDEGAPWAHRPIFRWRQPLGKSKLRYCETIAYDEPARSRPNTPPASP